MKIQKILFLIACIFIKPVFAQPKQSFEQKAIEDNVAISRWLDGIAEEIDLFLIGKKVTQRKNESSLKIENTTYVLQDEATTNSSGFNVNLRLPNVEDYWQLKFTSYDENEQNRGVQKGPLRKAPPEQKYGVGLGLFRKLGNVQTTFQPRVDLGSTLKVSHSLAFESTMEYTHHQVNPKLEFFANPDKGTGIYQALNFLVPLTDTFALSILNNGEYDDKPHIFSAANGVSLGQLITERSSLAYSLIFSSNNRDNYHLEDYTFSVAWSHVIYKRILDYQVTPYLSFPRTKTFTGTPGLTFNIALTF